MSNFSEEEKKAIERANFLIKIDSYLEKEMLTNLLHFINKQQKEIEMLKKQQQDVKNRIEYYLVGNVSLDNFEIRNKELRKIEKMLEE